MSLHAFVVPPRPPADLLITLVVTDDEQNGRAIASRPLPYGSAGNSAVWDAHLYALGFTRSGDWCESDDHRSHVCEVARR